MRWSSRCTSRRRWARCGAEPAGSRSGAVAEAVGIRRWLAASARAREARASRRGLRICSDKDWRGARGRQRLASDRRGAAVAEAHPGRAHVRAEAHAPHARFQPTWSDVHAMVRRARLSHSARFRIDPPHAGGLCPARSLVERDARRADAALQRNGRRRGHAGFPTPTREERRSDDDGSHAYNLVTTSPAAPRDPRARRRPLLANQLAPGRVAIRKIRRCRRYPSRRTLDAARHSTSGFIRPGADKPPTAGIRCSAATATRHLRPSSTSQSGE